VTEYRTEADWIRIQSEILDPAVVLAAASDESAGAIDLFLGVTRRWTRGKETVRLEYEAYEDMAVSEILTLVGEARSKWTLLNVVVHHRTGLVTVEEASVAIAVSSPHRADAFLASRYLIDRLKITVPIWKREWFADGSTEWIQGGPPVG
jgi:molybdopterin synthase catalytic subunit